MKRLYIALCIFVLCVGIGVFEDFLVKSTCDNCLENIKKIDSCIDSKDIKTATELSEKNEKYYEGVTDNLLNIFCSHDELGDIDDSLCILTEYLNNRDIKNYRVKAQLTKKQLRSAMNKELIKVQNIL